jgi:hypothetical protein
MKSILAACVCLLAASVLAQQPSAQQPPPPPAAPAGATPPEARKTMTPEERRQHIMEMVGGFVTKPTKLPGVLFLNLQQRVPHDFVAATARTIADSAKFKYSTEAAGGEAGAMIARALARTNDVGLVIAIVDEPGAPSLLTAQDAGWARVNVAYLATDNPGDERLRERLIRQLWRATGLVFGAGYSLQFPGSVMRPIRSLADLDAIAGRSYATDTLQVILKSAEQLGIANMRPFTYKVACEQGWAPAPTNQWQKAIWDAAKGGGTQ